jgi:O-antigen/teichoic acid export membrane protein
MKAWFQEDVLRRVLRNTGLLSVGKVAGAVLHLAALGLSARLLGPYAFGLLILVRSYAQAASGLAKFQSWQTLIRFGAVPAERHDVRGFRDLASFTLVIDAGSGLAGAAAAFVLVPLLAGPFGISGDAVRLTQLYCLAIPLLTSATPVGILRTFDRFDLLAWQTVVTPAARLTGVGVAAALGAPLWGYVLAWLASDVLGELFVWLCTWRELRRRGFTGGGRPSPRRAVRTHRGIVPFALATNFAATLSQATIPLFTLCVGGLLGTAASGMYRIAQIVTDAVATPAELAMRSLLPEAARLRARDGAHFWRVMARTLVLSAVLGLVLSLIVLVAGPAVLVAAMGPEYAEVGPVLRIVALAFVAIVAALPLETALIAIGAAGRLLAVRVVAAAATFALLAVLAPRSGLAGAAVAVTVGAFVTSAGMIVALLAARRADDGADTGQA